ncbi:MAG: NitT/TauT family transport system permease protein [Chloroflexota bacterium]|jgi:NitT/TauT family transport system permease protein|nr:NitT/TauT family transport system permease protein [Chloroflexota bacterium]
MARGRSRQIRRALGLIVIVGALLVIWEVAKFIGGDPWRLHGNVLGVQIDFFHNPPFRWRIVTDQSLPHVWNVIHTMTVPVQVNRPILASLLFDNMLFTMRGAATGFALGSAFGLMLGIVLANVRLLERALVPYVVISQTIPIIAVAPVIVIGLRAGTFSVALVAAYLTFFPVTIAALRGLRAADPRAIELMRSLAAGRWEVLRKVRLPAAAPYLFTAFKISATASVVGAIVGELPAGLREGLGGALLNFNQYYTIAPERLWAALLFAAAAGIVAFLLVVAAERFALRGYRPSEEPA